MQLMTIAALEQNVRIHSVLHHIGRTPLARNYSVVAQVPPEIVGEILRPAIKLPFAEHVEAVLIHYENPARSIAICRSERADIDSFRPAVYGVRRAVACPHRQRLGFDDLDDLRPPWIGLGVDDVNP